MRPVLILSNSLTGGGAEAVARLMVEKIAGARCIVFENDSQITITGKCIKATDHRYEGGLLTTIVVSLWRVFRIQWEKIRVRPLVTVSHLEGPNFSNMLTMFGGKRVLFVHNEISKNYLGDSLRSMSKRVLCKKLYRSAQLVVAVSPGIRNELITRFRTHPRRTLYLPNPIDDQAIQQSALKSYGDFRDDLCRERFIISVASLSQQKDHKLMLCIYAALIGKPEVVRRPKLVLVGDGALRGELRTLCQDLKLKYFDVDIHANVMSDSEVYFLGFQNNPFPLLSSAKLLLMTSQWEGLPICLLEAMALGIPAIVTDCSSGIRDLWEISGWARSDEQEGCPIDCAHGVIMPVGNGNREENISMWTQKIGMLLNDETSRDCFVRAGARRISDYRVEEVVKIWEREIFSPN